MAKRKENWKQVRGWPYEVSDLGRVRRIGKSKLLKLCKHIRGNYRAVRLCSGGRSRYVFVHVLVLETFVGRRPPGMEARHFPDPDPGNNKLGNLAWCTSKQNAADRKAHGTQVRGEYCHTARLTAAEVLEIRQRTESNVVLALEYGVHAGSISKIKRRETWAHV